MSVLPIPSGYHSVTPYLIVDGADAAIRFYAQAFGADELYRIDMGGKIGHAEIRIGDSIVMLADENPDLGLLGPARRGGASTSLMIYLADVDLVFKRALDVGGREEKPVQDQFYGDRSGTLIDPFGHRWTIATHIEDVPEEEIKRRLAELMPQPA